MKQLKLKDQRRRRRHWHIRKQVNGTPEKPRLNIFRSHKHIYCQLIDDSFVDKNSNRCGKTLVACSTLTPAIHEAMKCGGNVKAAEVIGIKIAELAIAKNITTVAFDRGGYRYHGRVKALAEAARKNGLKF